MKQLHDSQRLNVSDGLLPIAFLSIYVMASIAHIRDFTF
jgi:hypothetical protein